MLKVTRFSPRTLNILKKESEVFKYGIWCFILLLNQCDIENTGKIRFSHRILLLQMKQLHIHIGRVSMCSTTAVLNIHAGRYLETPIHTLAAFPPLSSDTLNYKYPELCMNYAWIPCKLTGKYFNCCHNQCMLKNTAAMQPIGM